MARPRYFTALLVSGGPIMGQHCFQLRLLLGVRQLDGLLLPFDGRLVVKLNGIARRQSLHRGNVFVVVAEGLFVIGFRKLRLLQTQSGVTAVIVYVNDVELWI